MKNPLNALSAFLSVCLSVSQLIQPMNTMKRMKKNSRKKRTVWRRKGRSRKKKKKKKEEK